MPYAMNEGSKIYYEVIGKGPPLFLHVGAFVEGDLWKLAGYTDRLRDYRLILIDPRGRGKSDKPKTLAAHRMKNYVGDVVRILDDLKISKVAFWGHSDGARVGYALALTRPSRVEALIALAGHDLPTEWKDRVATASDIGKKGLGWVQELVEKSHKGKLPKWYGRRQHKRDPRMGELEMLAWRSWINKWDMYPRINAPTLVMAGDQDDRTGLSRKIAETMPNGKFVLLKGLGHFDAFMRSELSTPPSTRFLRQHIRQ